MKRKILLPIVILSLVSVAIYINRATIIQKIQIYRLKSIKCYSSQLTCHDILWVHSVNSIKKYKELEADFPGFEIDVTYIDSLQSFYVFHPPLKDLQQTPTWQEFSEAIDLQNKRFYLDMRGVDSSNVNKAAQILQNNPYRLLLKKQTVIELYDCYAAHVFHNMGYNVTLSYSALSKLPAKDLQNIQFKEKIKDINQLSGDIEVLSEMKEKFPDKNYMIWSLSYKNYLNIQRLENTITDKSIALILVSIASKYNR
ncbi:MAG: hypothetical protein ACTHMM_22525 [Agriterribacter sp.]